MRRRGGAAEPVSAARLASGFGGVGDRQADETDDLIRYVRNKLDEFENVFIKKEEAENEKQ